MKLFFLKPLYESPFICVPVLSVFDYILFIFYFIFFCIINLAAVIC